MKLNPDELRVSAVECLKRAERAAPANVELWSQIAAGYRSLAEEVESTPACPPRAHAGQKLSSRREDA
jgi:hypothetical protein